MLQSPAVDNIFDNRFYEFRRSFFDDDEAAHFGSGAAGLLSDHEIYSIWIHVESEFSSDTAENRSRIALVLAEEKIVSNLEYETVYSSAEHLSQEFSICTVTYQELHDHIDSVAGAKSNDDIYSRRGFAYFMHLFEGQLADKLLRNIWTEECRLRTSRVASTAVGGEDWMQAEWRVAVAVVESACAIALDYVEIGE